MNHAISSYGVDMVIGNKLNNKQWIAIEYNKKSVGERDSFVYDG